MFLRHPEVFSGMRGAAWSCRKRVLETEALLRVSIVPWRDSRWPSPQKTCPAVCTGDSWVKRREREGRGQSLRKGSHPTALQSVPGHPKFWGFWGLQGKLEMVCLSVVLLSCPKAGRRDHSQFAVFL